MELTFKRMVWNHVQVVVEYFKDDSRCEVERVVDCFPLYNLENKYFVEVLTYLLSYGEAEYKTWFNEYIYTPHRDGKPMTISEVDIRKIENGEVFAIDLKKNKSCVIERLKYE